MIDLTREKTDTTIYGQEKDVAMIGFVPLQWNLKRRVHLIGSIFFLYCFHGRPRFA